MNENPRTDIDLINYFNSLSKYAHRIGFNNGIIVGKKSFILCKSENDQYYFDTLDEISIFLCNNFGLNVKNL